VIAARLKGMAIRDTLLAFCAGLALLTPASAQVRPDPEATVVEGLLSSAALKGPPWWKAEKNGRMVYILGLPPPCRATWTGIRR